MLERTIPSPYQFLEEVLAGEPTTDDLDTDSLHMVELIMGMDELAGEGDDETLEGDIKWMDSLSEGEQRMVLLRYHLQAGQTVTTYMFGMKVEITPATDENVPPKNTGYEGPDPSGDREPRKPFPSTGSLQTAI